MTENNETFYDSAEAAEETEFTLVNSNGGAARVEELGLLLYNGGTVCDDDFDDNAAEAICVELGFEGALRWTNENSFTIQSNYDINLDEVHCESDSWDSCEFATTHDCSHSEDVFLMCHDGSCLFRGFQPR